MSAAINSFSTIVIIDFGSQYTQLIARRVRQGNAYSIIQAPSLTERKFKELNPIGVILSGGPETVTNTNPEVIPDFIFNANIPILAICYSMQAIAKHFGGTVSSTHSHEFGKAEITIANNSLLFTGIEDAFDATGQSKLTVWMSHRDSVTDVPSNFVINTTNDKDAILAISDDQQKIYGLQFHPEVSHTTQGQRIINRFVHRICQADATWKPNFIIAQQIETIKHQIQDDHVILALSGGVDSLVCAILLHRAIDSRLHCVHVDNGLLRHGESELVKSIFEKHTGIPLTVIDAKKEFLKALRKEANPEKKRKIIGATFIKVFERHAKTEKLIKHLAQGTIYPDVIESAKSSPLAKIIKSHHNVGGLPKRMNLKVIEPLRNLFKDEVRAVGEELGLPKDSLNRHPFPGPGLAVRILGPVNEANLNIAREADRIFIEELKQHNLYHTSDQAFCVFIPQKTVGVKGDGRIYEYIIAIRAVSTTDYMTATPTELPHTFLTNTARRITNTIPNISRVVYDITEKPPATIEWE